MSNLLSVKNLNLKVGNKTMCKNLSFDLNEGMCIGVLGVNGSGKTTLLKTVAGLISPNGGGVKIFGNDINRLDAKTRAKYIGILLQKLEHNFPATVFETALNSRFVNIGFWGDYSGTDRNLVKQYLQFLNLDFTQVVHTLSGGELQRLAIAMVLAQQPQVYLLDEPLNNLDLRYHSLVVDNFGKTSGKASVVILHDLLIARKMCSHLLLLNEGESLFGNIDEIYTRQNLEWLFTTKLQKIKVENKFTFYVMK